MTVRIVETLREWRQLRAELRPLSVDWQNKHKAMTLGFVPTMGALHEGHASLVERAKSENDLTVVSIFVNPTQFDNPADLEKYPRTLEADLELLSQLGVEYVFVPRFRDLYPLGYRYRIHESELSKRLCGAHRPGHFDGVLTVVMKLLQIIQPHRAYFGEKDYQQLRLVQDMAEEFFLCTKIVACPTVREPDGLAMSSRNRRLNSEQRKLAAEFQLLLRTGISPAEIRRALEVRGFQVDYVEEWEGRRFGAVHLGQVRLIDNVPIT